MTDNLPALPSTDTWINVLADVGQLARSIASTPFVPQNFRDQPASIAAAILTGRELNVQPMTALAHIHVVNGRPGMSAQLMRQLILAAGHSLRYIETTDTRCIVEGRRRGEDWWTRAEFTADQARKASIQLGSYPADKLVARATSRLARRAFADCLGGVPYLTEELQDLPQNATDGPVSLEAVQVAPDSQPSPTAPQKARRTAQRALPPTTLQTETPQKLDQPEKASRAQIIAIHARSKSLDIEPHSYATQHLGRPVETLNDLSPGEASTLLDQLTMPDEPTLDE